MTIYEIKERTEKTSPYFFSKNTLKFFGQKMSDFHIKKQPDGKYLIWAKIKTAPSNLYTERLFNPETNELELITKTI